VRRRSGVQLERNALLLLAYWNSVVMKNRFIGSSRDLGYTSAKLILVLKYIRCKGGGAEQRGRNPL